MLDECVAVELFGFKQVVGLIATGNHWRLTSTRPLLVEDQADIVEKIDSLRQNSSNEQQNECGSPQQGMVVFQNRKGKKKKNAEDERNTLHASKIVPGIEGDVRGAGEEIVKLIVAYVLKACVSLVDLLDRKHPLDTIIIRPKMPCRILKVLEMARQQFPLTPEPSW